MTLLYFSTFFLACGESEKEDTAVTTTEASVEPSTEPEDPCISEDGAEGFRFEGDVVFSDGTEGKGNVRVQMCNPETCYIGKWGDNGFCFPEGNLPSGFDYSFDTVPLIGEENQFATPLSVITINEGDPLLRLEKPVIIPEFTFSTTNATGDLDIGNGLTIPATEELEGGSFYSVNMTPEESGLPLDQFQDRTIIGLWYLGPFETHFAIPLPFTLNNEQTSNLELGTQVEIYNASYDNQEWSLAGTATISETGSLSSDVDSGISILSSLLLVQ